MKTELKYQSGFGNHFESEAIKGALPKEQNSPRNAPLGLYAEQLSGSAFTRPRDENRKIWFYRIRPSVVQGEFKPVSPSSWNTVGPCHPPSLS